MGGGGVYLTGNLDLTSNLDVVIVVVGVWSDPEAAFLQSCGEATPLVKTIFQHSNRGYDDVNGDNPSRAEH